MILLRRRRKRRRGRGRSRWSDACLPGVANSNGTVAVGTKQQIAIGIALQTQVLKTCPLHQQLYCDDEECSDNENMARAFAVAVELVRHEPYAEEFHHDAHELTDILSYTIGATPEFCPECMPTRYPANGTASAESSASG
jgi:hypothetical protein